MPRITRLATFYNTACTLCRMPINGEGILLSYDPVCLDCAMLISLALDLHVRKAKKEEITEDEGEKTKAALSCSTCGEQFRNRGKFLAHRKKCGKEHKNGLKVEALA